MGKVISFELKKLVSRIGIYILVALMAGLLVVAAFMHKPTERVMEHYQLAGASVSAKYADFETNMQNGYMSQVTQTAKNADTYVKTSSTYNKANSQIEISNLFIEFDDYCRQYYEVMASEDEYKILQQGILHSFNNLYTALDSALEYSEKQAGYYILTTKSNHTELFSILDKINVNFASPISHKVAGERYFTEYRNKLNTCLNALIYPNLTNVAENYAANGKYYSLINMRMEEVAIKMKSLADMTASTPLLDADESLNKKINDLFNQYVAYADIFVQAYSSDLCVEALSSISNKTIKANLVGYDKVSIYDQSELAVEYKYYIINNTFPTDYATGLSITHTSNGEINTYDFTFFILAVFGVIVIIFAIYLSANTIAGEISHNTMRFTSIRPVSRGAIFFGKYLSIIIISFVILLFATLAAFITGGVLFGFESANILMIINSSRIFTAHPAVVILIFMFSQLLMVAIYSAITMLLSSFIKSELLTLIIGMLLYLVNFVLPLFFGVASWLRFYPFANINLFAYFNSTNLTNNSIMSQLFNTVVYNGMNMWISLIYIIMIPIITLIIGKLAFKKREL